MPLLPERDIYSEAFALEVHYLAKGALITACEDQTNAGIADPEIANVQPVDPGEELGV